MPIRTSKYAGNLPGVSIIVDGDPQDSGLGPYVPWSSVTDVGERVITAPTAAIARQALGIAFAGNALLAGDIVQTAIAYTLVSGVGLVLVDSDTGAFDVTVARALVNPVGDPVLALVLKVGSGVNPVLIKDDLGAVIFALVQGGQAMCFVTVIGGTVYANGVT
jgi:hypothetical protein